MALTALQKLLGFTATRNKTNAAYQAGTPVTVSKNQAPFGDNVGGGLIPAEEE